MQTLYFVRHGEADYNLLNRVNAHPHVPNNLTVTGREQAACCRLSLRDTPIAVMYCSEFPRTQQTANILNEHCRVPLIIDARINETGAFAFEGKPVQQWHSANVPDRCNARIPGCEPLAEMKLRLAQFLSALRSAPQQHIVVVSHAEPIQIMLGILQAQADSDALQRPISHCLPIRIEIDSRDEKTHLEL